MNQPGYSYNSYYYAVGANNDGNQYSSELRYENNNGSQWAHGWIQVNENVWIHVKSVGLNAQGILMAVILQYIKSRDQRIYMRTVVVPYSELVKIIKPPYIPLLTDFY